MGKKAIIIGAGPAGLTAAYELLKRTDITPIILEKSGDIGGISKTINYKGNRMDIGGHRFFSKSDRVMNWWMNIMPVQPSDDTYSTITYQRNHRTIKKEETHGRGNGEELSKMMLIRKRLSRIYFLRKFFTYPIQLSIDTLRKLGPLRTLGILASYTKAQLFQRKPEKSLEDFLINRFGKKLYLLFFKDYTEKVWGVPCKEISAEWGAQRIKGVSVSKAIQHAIQAIVKKKKGTDISQKGTETSLIEQFLYPALGPGQLWEEVARQIEVLGGKIFMHEDVKEIQMKGNQIKCVITQNSETGEQTEYCGDYFFSTMPVQELIAGMNGQVPEDVKEIAAGLQYRDFITIGVLLKKLDTTDNQKTLPDTWIYIQEKDVKVGRLQIFNNWSPFMVKDPDTVWIGMEYFCNKEDEFWNLPDEEIQRVGVIELEKMGLANIEDVLDSTVLRMEKTYPAYFGTYNQFDKIREFTDQFENLFLVGRNGMHKYNNSDHSMLTAMVSVDNISAGVISKENIWAINTEQEYHEEKIDSNNNLEKIMRKSSLPEPKPVFAKVAKEDSFRNFLFKYRCNKIYLCLVVIVLFVQFAIFKHLYPYPSFINDDSYVYLQTAYANLNISIYPVGYAKFLRLFSVFSTSDTALVAFQYLLLQASILSFLFTLFYFYQPSKKAQVLLLGFLVLNPAFLYLCNYVSSDALFISLSLLWFTLLLWILYRPSTSLIMLHGLVLFLAFIVRYNALFYPLIAGFVFLLSKQRILVKLAGSALGILLIVAFIHYTSNKYYELSGIRQFSPFTGWQIANNALNAYRYVDSQDVKPVPAKFRQLDKMVRTYIDTSRDILSHPMEMLTASTIYMWDPRSPLQHYMQRKFERDTSIGKLKRWATVAPLYSDYGFYLIRQYPMAFIEYYLWPNSLKYYAPPVEFLEKYSTGVDSVKAVAQIWFGYKNNKIKSRVKDFKVEILNYYPILIGMLNVLFFCSLLGFVFMKGYKYHPQLTNAIFLVASLWVVNFGFSVIASPIALRFQLFPITVFISFTFLFIDHIFKMATLYEVKDQQLKSGRLQLTE